MSLFNIRWTKLDLIDSDYNPKGSKDVFSYFEFWKDMQVGYNVDTSSHLNRPVSLALIRNQLSRDLLVL